MLSQAAEASHAPSGETASATIGALCPSQHRLGLLRAARARSRCARPRRLSRRGRRAAARPRSPHRHESAAPARRNCARATSGSRNESKLPESASLPSADTATLRTGPPWPRSCACAGAQAINTTSRTTAREIIRPRPRDAAASTRNRDIRSPRRRCRSPDRPECRRCTGRNTRGLPGMFAPMYQEFACG